ncbi:pyruvate ferredoxin oxidoreductase alpha subunit [Phycisphaerales bacterium]|nr:pyruvate ferredoxin oxidoreductase alpha subunit [Phycisphaerales bacterium]
MLKQCEGSQAIAEVVAMCRPEVICAYPITPQTHIVETLSSIVKAGRLKPCEFINVESEFGALSVAIGASAMGARAYTATASQGILFMAEAVYNAAGLGLPMVMTVGNRSIGAPINIWNDHTDSMSMRDAGWIQLYAHDNQEAADLHIQAFRLGEALSLPVMVCVDGFILTHAYDRIDVPTQEQVDTYLSPYEPQQVLDPDNPVTIGAMVGPEAFTEVRYLAHHKQLQALELIPALAAEFKATFGRDSGGLLHTYRTDDADTIVCALGSVNGTIRDVVDDMRGQGVRIGSVSLCTYRPFPSEALRTAMGHARRVITIEKSLSVGIGGNVSHNLRMALPDPATRVHTVIAGLGGRPITRASLKRVFAQAIAGTLQPLTFLDLNTQVIERQLERERAVRRSGPAAEAILRDIGINGAAQPEGNPT